MAVDLATLIDWTMNRLGLLEDDDMVSRADLLTWWNLANRQYAALSRLVLVSDTFDTTAGVEEYALENVYGVRAVAIARSADWADDLYAREPYDAERINATAGDPSHFWAWRPWNGATSSPSDMNVVIGLQPTPSTTATIAFDGWWIPVFSSYEGDESVLPDNYAYEPWHLVACLVFISLGDWQSAVAAMDRHMQALQAGKSVSVVGGMP